MSRPELQGPPEFYYNEDEATKYATNSRIRKIQAEMSERAIELLALPADRKGLLILDVGCGSGLSGQAIEEHGHHWLGLDISSHMLALTEGSLERGDVVQQDMGMGVPFRPGTFDGCISVSALQWLCNADKRWHNPHARLMKFFESLYNALSQGTRAVFQFYPADQHQMELITATATKCGFTGGVVVDFPHSTKAKKFYLVLMCGQSTNMTLPKGYGEESQRGGVQVAERMRKGHGKTARRGKRGKLRHKDWVQAKKERQRAQGKNVKSDSKYTARKRKDRF